MTHAEMRLPTRWAADVDAAAPHPEYPRPQMQRAAWTNLNGPWDYAIVAADAGQPADWDGVITVPFAPESDLSGVRRDVLPTEALWYRRAIPTPDRATTDHVLLHFEAADWRTTVFVNGHEAGTHEGGSDAFSFDITDLLADAPHQEIVVRCWDPTDTATQPRGKQVMEPGGIWYKAVTGIWQTVWLEVVPAAHIAGLEVLASLDDGTITATVTPSAACPAGARIDMVVRDGGTEIARAEGTVASGVRVAIEHPRPWSPADPALYDIEVTLTDGGSVDRVASYTAFRKIETRVAPDGHRRIYLNGEPIFLYGPLDQGWWPDGLLTPPTDDAMRWDIEAMKALGHNCVRKHIKVEPARWYAWCDRLGLLVWQDIPSGYQTGKEEIHFLHPESTIEQDNGFTPEEHAIFVREMTAIIHMRRSSPCIVIWTPFNEGWGQHQTNETLGIARDLAANQLICGPSGWKDFGEGDLLDMHEYPGPGMPESQDGRASVLGEFGGLTLPIGGHMWVTENLFGYKDMKSPDDLLAEYGALVDGVMELKARGLAAAIYTQLTDVEGEVNGYVTYDRAVEKMPRERLAEMHARLTS